MIAISCNNRPIEPFELLIADSDYSLGYSIRYKISDKKLKVIFHGELENEKDSILYETTKLPKQKIQQLSSINVDSLNVYYANSCMRDGDIKSFRFTKNQKTKSIQLQNYYHEELSLAIEIINEIVPKKFKMHHDKVGLIKNMERCGKSTIKSWDQYHNKSN